MLTAAHEAGARTAVHCCAPDVPIGLLRDAGAQALALDVTLLGPNGWESVAASVEAGTRLWAGPGADARRGPPRRPSWPAGWPAGGTTSGCRSSTSRTSW